MQWPQLIILTLGLCGLRWGELVALRVEDVDLQRDRLTISKSITRIGVAGWLRPTLRRTRRGW